MCGQQELTCMIVTLELVSPVMYSPSEMVTSYIFRPSKMAWMSMKVRSLQQYICPVEDTKSIHGYTLSISTPSHSL